MRRSPVLAIIVLTLASSLAACGGGGGGSALPSTSLPPPTSKTAKILATFGSSGTTPQSLRALLAKPAATVVGQIIPTQQLYAPDSYMTGAPVTGVEAQAVLDTTDGSAIPNPLPAVTWSQSGNPAPVPTAYPTWNVTACTCQQVFSAEVIGTPSEPGQTTISMTSMGGTQNLTLITYRAMGLRSSMDTGNIFGALTGAMFDSSGVSEPADSQADTDVYFDASTSPSQVVFPYGAIAVGYNALDAIKSTGDCGAIPTTSTTVVPSNSGAADNTYCFRTHDGRIGKWGSYASSDADIFAGYMLASSGSFAY